MKTMWHVNAVLCLHVCQVFWHRKCYYFVDEFCLDFMDFILCLNVRIIKHVLMPLSYFIYVWMILTNFLTLVTEIKGLEKPIKPCEEKPRLNNKSLLYNHLFYRRCLLVGNVLLPMVLCIVHNLKNLPRIWPILNNLLRFLCQICWIYWFFWDYSHNFYSLWIIFA